MAEHPNVALIKAVYAAAKGAMTALNDLFAEDILWHAAGGLQPAGVSRAGGRLLVPRQAQGPCGGITSPFRPPCGLCGPRARRRAGNRHGEEGDRTLTWNGGHVFHLRDGKVVESGTPTPISTPTMSSPADRAEPLPGGRRRQPGPQTSGDDHRRAGHSASPTMTRAAHATRSASASAPPIPRRGID